MKNYIALFIVSLTLSLFVVGGLHSFMSACNDSMTTGVLVGFLLGSIIYLPLLIISKNKSS
jgi:hypothetical protein